jgi:ZIP family zinc transporter/zinc and cadmium transporter
MNFGEILFSSTLAATAALSGTALVLCCEPWARRNSVFLISFATGVMLSIAFLNLLPESLALHPASSLWVFIGFLVLYALQNVVMFHPCHDDDCPQHLGLLSSVGLAIHAALDGIIISVGFEASQSLGLLTSLAVMLHKIPDGITITSILLHSQFPRRRIVTISAGIALLTPIGAALAYLFLRGIAPSYLGIFIALTAGSFIYLAAADLLPETHRVHHRANGAFFFFGVAVVILLERLCHH